MGIMGCHIHPHRSVLSPGPPVDDTLRGLVGGTGGCGRVAGRGNVLTTFVGGVKTSSSLVDMVLGFGELLLLLSTPLEG